MRSGPGGFAVCVDTTQAVWSAKTAIDASSRRARAPCFRFRPFRAAGTVISSGLSRPRIPSSMPRTNARWPRIACLVLSRAKNAIRPSTPSHIVMKSWSIRSQLPCLRANMNAFRPMK